MAQPAQKAHLVVYVGTDQSFWQSIVNRFRQTYPQQAFEFVTLKVPKEGHAQEIFVELLDRSPLIVYLDFTHSTEQLMLWLSS